MNLQKLTIHQASFNDFFKYAECTYQAYKKNPLAPTVQGDK